MQPKTPRLTPPPARQGPGPLPRPVVDRLGLSVARRAIGLLAGDVRSPGVGRGTELAQLRPYQPGDDVRRLDPSASARTGVPHVRLDVPERALTTWVVLDVSPSMAFGTADRLKSDVAAGVVRVLAELGLRRAGRVAIVACGGDEPVVLPPRSGRAAMAGVMKLLDAGVVADGAGRADALQSALRLVELMAKRVGLIVVVSDFQGDDLKRPLAALAHRHSVLAVEVRDRHELDLPVRGRLAVVDPETGRHVEVDVDDRVRKRFAQNVHDERERLAKQLRGLGVEHVVLRTDEPWLISLGRVLEA